MTTTDDRPIPARPRKGDHVAGRRGHHGGMAAQTPYRLLGRALRTVVVPDDLDELRGPLAGQALSGAHARRVPVDGRLPRSRCARLQDQSIGVAVSSGFASRLSGAPLTCPYANRATMITPPTMLPSTAAASQRG